MPPRLDNHGTGYERWLWPVFWLVVVVTGLATRSYFPLDETRYLGVAWEMWHSGDWLVPHLNGVPYSHKPPLLFWLINAGWKVFGVNPWWPRIVPALFALGCLLLVRRLGSRLWPGRAAMGNGAPLLLQGTFLWMAYSTMLMFDMLLTFFVLLGLAGIFAAGRRLFFRGWSLTGIAIGLAILAKGPVALLYVLPPALLAPWWADKGLRRSWFHWYAGLVAALMLGAIIALAWALPAAQSGGHEYGDAILWGQTAHRIAGDSVPHARPAWWYLAVLPVFLFPWLLWPPVWRGIIQLAGVAADHSVRFCLAWLAPAFVILSLIESKQPQYLIPVIPAFALLAARGLARHRPHTITRWQASAPAIGLAIAGIILTLLPFASSHFENLSSMQQVSGVWGAGLLLVPVGVVALPVPTPRLGVARWGGVTVVFLVIIHFGPLQAITEANDVRPMGQALSRLQHDGISIAWVGSYADQYHFAGRLTRPLDVIENDELSAWITGHPGGAVVLRYQTWEESLAQYTIFAQPYRGGGIAVWPASKLAPPASRISTIEQEGRR